MSDERARPPGLWVVGVLAILLGCLGTCGGAFGMGTLFFQDSLLAAQQQAMDQAGQSDEQRERQLELQRGTVEIARQYRTPTIAAQVVNLLSSFVLIIGAVLLFRWSPATFVVFAVGCAGSALADIAIAVIGTIQQQETMALMASELSSTGNAQADRMTQGVFRASGTFGMCFTGGWVLAKLAFYAGAVLTLRTPEARRLFD